MKAILNYLGAFYQRIQNKTRKLPRSAKHYFEGTQIYCWITYKELCICTADFCSMKTKSVLFPIIHLILNSELSMLGVQGQKERKRSIAGTQLQTQSKIVRSWSKEKDYTI